MTPQTAARRRKGQERKGKERKSPERKGEARKRVARKPVPRRRVTKRPLPWGRIVARALIAGFAFVALVAFSAVLARLTLTPSPASADVAGSNMRPGHSLRQYAESYTFLGACKQIGRNLLLGAPFGLLLPVLVPRKGRMMRVLAVTVLVMALVELAQGAIVEGRAFDVDDVILNTTGALIAYFLIGRRIGHSYHALARPSGRNRLAIRLPGKGVRYRGTPRATGDGRK
ncbi:MULTISPECIES: VanZ family protein [unclassified Streptomyces]|uniref:VanZ family protein n=1 Tax=unclassified Streptomyces TaxID=2593676 RepID=UPI0036E0E0FA